MQNRMRRIVINFHFLKQYIIKITYLNESEKKYTLLYKLKLNACIVS